MSQSRSSDDSAGYIKTAGKPQTPSGLISRKRRFYIIAAVLMALFLGALDALVMNAAMPTIVADLGSLDLYSWVYSAYLLAGRSYDWMSPEIFGLSVVTVGSGIAFYFIENKAREPILSPGFFKVRGFSIGNGAAFLASFTIFSQFAYSPFFIQGALGKSPLQMGVAMLSLSLGWSAGAMACGQSVNRFGKKLSAIFGALCLAVGSAIMVTFSATTSLTSFFVVLGTVGIGMGFVSIATLLIVQDSLEMADLGIATASHQFFRTLGGTIGVGVTGSFVTLSLSKIEEYLIQSGLNDLPPSFHEHMQQGFDRIFRPEIQALFAPDVQKALQEAVARGVSLVFWISLFASVLCLVLAAMLPSPSPSRSQ